MNYNQQELFDRLINANDIRVYGKMCGISFEIQFKNVDVQVKEGNELTLEDLANCLAIDLEGTKLWLERIDYGCGILVLSQKEGGEIRFEIDGI